MCLVSKNYKTRKEQRLAANTPLIAKEDIVVYKVLQNDLTSPHRVFQYERNTHYYQEGKKFGMSKDHVDYADNWYFTIDQGLHAYTSELVADRNRSILYDRIYEMVVPKGSQYYISRCGKEIVSDNLIFY